MIYFKISRVVLIHKDDKIETIALGEGFSTEAIARIVGEHCRVSPVGMQNFMGALYQRAKVRYVASGRSFGTIVVKDKSTSEPIARIIYTFAMTEEV